LISSFALLFKPAYNFNWVIIPKFEIFNIFGFFNMIFYFIEFNIKFINHFNKTIQIYLSLIANCFIKNLIFNYYEVSKSV
jgi:hypothetical protein